MVRKFIKFSSFNSCHNFGKIPVAKSNIYMTLCYINIIYKSVFVGNSIHILYTFNYINRIQQTLYK